MRSTKRIGVRFILAPGCSIPDDTAQTAMDVARVAADQLAFNDED